MNVSKFKVGDLVEARVRIYNATYGSWHDFEIEQGTWGIVEKVEEVGGEEVFRVAWEYGNSLTVRSIAHEFQISQMGG